jgi:hypothetical protein
VSGTGAVSRTATIALATSTAIAPQVIQGALTALDARVKRISILYQKVSRTSILYQKVTRTVRLPLSTVVKE